jgi:hypothetical protein
MSHIEDQDSSGHPKLGKGDIAMTTKGDMTTKDMLGFFFAGLFNNSSYVIMLAG